MNYNLCKKIKNSEIFNFRKKLKIRNSNLYDKILKSSIIEVEGWNLVWMILVHLFDHKWYRTLPLPSPFFTPSSPPSISKIFSNSVRSLNLVRMILIHHFKHWWYQALLPSKILLLLDRMASPYTSARISKANFDTNVIVAGPGYTEGAQDWQVPHFTTICGAALTLSPSTPKAIPTSSHFPSPTLIPSLMVKPFFPPRPPPLTEKGNVPLSLLSSPPPPEWRGGDV